MQKANMMYSTEVYVVRGRRYVVFNALLPSHRRNIYIIESGRAVRGRVIDTQAKIMDEKPNLQQDGTMWKAKYSLRLIYFIISLLSGET